MSWTAPPYDDAIEIRDHLDETGWRSAIRAICEREGLESSALAPFSTGSDVVWSAGKAVVKLTPPRFREELENEARALEAVAGALPVATPRALAVGAIDRWPYVVMSRVDGVALGTVWERLHHDERVRLAAALGELTRELHALPAQGRDGWDEFWSFCRTDVAERHRRRGAPEALVREVQPFLDAVGVLPCESRVFAHTELLDQHVLVEERNGAWELAALIDFADSRSAPREYEFPAPVEFLFRGEPGTLRAYLLGYGLGPGEWTRELAERYLAWGLCHRFGSLARMLEAVERWKPEPKDLPGLAHALYDLDA